jgi:hypothetical protein
MSSPAPTTSVARTWRDIPQTIAPRAMSSTGRKRMMFATAKSVAVLVLACVSLWGGYEIFSLWQEDPAKVKSPVKSSPVKNITLRGENLVLTQEWVVRTLALPKNADLMELDLYALRDRLLESGQVRSVVITRKFPDTLVVSMEERSPVARLNARFGDGEPETFLVARDGVVFRGACFKDEVLQSLPFLGGVALKRVSGKLQPIEGMERVTDLLNTALVNAPELYRSWTIVSLEKLTSDGHILVQAPYANQIVFGTREDFYRQIARLDFIVDESKKAALPQTFEKVDLSIGPDQVPVSFALPAAEPLEPQVAPRTGETSRSAPPASVARPAQQSVAHRATTPPKTTLRPAAVRTSPTRPSQASNARAQRSASRRDF